METDKLEDSQISLEAKINLYKAKLLPFAYNIVGDLLEAEDIVQETLNKYYLEPQQNVIKPFNYLAKSVINKSINHKKLLRTRKEMYPGEWLPVPVYTEETIYSKVDKSHILNYSLLVLMERLKPYERAVFILKETYDFPHQDIAAFLEITDDNSRQILKRAKQKLQPQISHPLSIKKENEKILKQLSRAIQNMDVEGVKHLLSASIQATSDGGSKVSAAKNILAGEDRVYKFLKALWHKYLPGSSKKLVYVNHKPALIFYHEGRVFRCMVFEIIDSRIEQIYIIVNPDKLQYLNSLV